MKIIVGDIVRNEVNRSGKPKTFIAKEIKLSRNQLNNILGDDHMELEYIVRIGKAIKHEFANDLPEMTKYFAEEPSTYEAANNWDLKNELLELQRKYIGLQEMHIKTLNELMEFKAAK